MTDTPAFMTDSMQNDESPAAADAPRPARKPARGKPPPPQASPVLEKLFELYPRLFGARFLPLKLGVYEDLLARHPDAFKPEDLKVAMGQHARSTRYLDAVVSGQPRHDLDGNPVEPVAPEHVHHAILEVFRRRQLRSPEDLRPKLIERLVQAIDASGLDREAYTARVRVNNESANALLDEAFAEWGRRTAKREALVRAFEASGKSEAEFAEMYGMKLAEVKSALAQARRSTAAPR